MSRDDEFNDDEFNGEEFIALLEAGDDEAWDMVCDWMWRPISTFIRHKLGEEAEHKQAAEDIFQDVFLSFRESFQEGKSHYEGRGPLLSYLCIIARRKVIKFLVQSSRNRKVIIDIDREDDSSNYSIRELPDPRPDPEKLFEEKEFEESIKSMFRALPTDDRDVLILKFRKKNWEIAEILGITRNNVRVRVFRARKRLRKLLRFRDEGQWRGISVIERSGMCVVKRVWGAVARMVPSPRAGDIIEKIGDKPVTKGNPFAQVTKEFAAAEDVILTVIRGEERNRRVEIIVPGTQNGGGRPFSKKVTLPEAGEDTHKDVKRFQRTV